LNGISRCAHSGRGGAATFGFSDVAELTHQMESLLDKLRRHELDPNSAMVDVLLESADISRVLLARHQTSDTSDPPSTVDLVRRISELAAGGGVTVASAPAAPASVPSAPVVEPVPVVAAPAPPAPVAPTAVAAEPPPAAASGQRVLEVRMGPLDRPELADGIKDLFRDISGLGEISELPSQQADYRLFKVVTTSSNDDLLDLFVFHVSREQVHIQPMGGAPTASPAAPAQMIAPVAATPAASAPPAVAAAAAPPKPAAPATFGFFDGAPGAPGSEGAPKEASSPVTKAAARPAAASTSSVQPEAATIRVAISKVDQLINLVGELVITQAMLAQYSQTLDPTQNQQLLAGLADLSRNTRDLQESVMSIRMIPMSIVFNRFPRMLRDLASKLGKKVDFVTLGEATELDKGLVEKITDPLTHLVRNSCDHGIEMPADRLSKGKTETGTITLSAAHQGGSIVIEVRDDGRGLSRDKIMNKARERGIDVYDQMTDAEVWQLIFAPGFSTAEVVTDVSGRGVGMDVVKKNIAALNGSVEIESSEGFGMKVSVRLPLTLAIMDGMSVGVGDEVYILPLSAVVESFQVKGDALSTVGQGSQLVKVRDEYMPVIELEKVFQVPRYNRDQDSDIMVVIEAEGSRVVLLVDELLGQQQVVVKNLEANYRKVPNVSGATILGDGKVALILDTSALVRRSRH